MTATSTAFEVVVPDWLVAEGDTDLLQVARSHLVREDDSMYEPVRRFIADNGLVLAYRETLEEPCWGFGQVVVSVYGTDPDAAMTRWLLKYAVDQQESSACAGA